MKNLLLLSNSTNFGETYMQWCSAIIASFVAGKSDSIIFIPYAGVGVSYSDYTNKVNDALFKHGLSVQNLDNFEDKKAAIANASAIFVGGGNTFHLLKMLQLNDLIKPVRNAVENGIPYVGWSAGSNIACPTIGTTNDMPIVQPLSFEGLNLVPFQINPHFTQDTLPKHGGESRLQRLKEYLTVNPTFKVVALPESTYLFSDDMDQLYYKGLLPGKILTKEETIQLNNLSKISN